jgi:D-lyxose ketol-isomerase
MKRSDINQLVSRASACFSANGWALPPNPKWDVTDFGLGDWTKFGLVLINLAEEPEYCEKLMYVQRGMVTPAHTHARKKEDIICRWGTLKVTVWKGKPDALRPEDFTININGETQRVFGGDSITLHAGERITLVQGIYHEFVCSTDECIIGEVSTANDDANDNYFANPEVGRFSTIIEDVPSNIQLISD